MKKRLYLIFPIIALTLMGCTKMNTSAEVIKDCTGVYLRIDGKDYLVCNDDVLSGKEDNEMVKVRYEIINECDQPPELQCYMAHDYEGVIEVKSVN